MQRIKTQMPISIGSRRAVLDYMGQTPMAPALRAHRSACLHLLLLCASLFVGATGSRASCLEDNRQIKTGSDSIVRIRSYLCHVSDQPNSPEIRAEYYRLSDGAISELTGGGTSSSLQNVFGSPKVIENELTETYRDLVRRFGMVVRTGPNARSLTLNIETPGKVNNEGGIDVQEQHSGRLSSLLDTDADHPEGDFPALKEIVSLQKRVIPSGLNFFYLISQCHDKDDADLMDKPRCNNFKASESRFQFWRPLTVADVQNYATNVATYNGLLHRHRKDPISVQTPKELQLFRYLAGGQELPEDFSLLIGRADEAGCGDERTGLGWSFQYTSRLILMDAILIRNVSSQAITLAALLGSSSSAKDLRVPPDEARTTYPGNSQIDLSVSLGPNQSVLFPTRIKFVPDEFFARAFPYRQTASAIFQQVGSRGFGGNTMAHSTPRIRDYVYGTDIFVMGLVADGHRVDFSSKSANFLNLTIASEAGSCPYLLADRNGTWETYGKILHSANNQSSETSQTITYADFIVRFRLEEREREMASIDEASIVYLLKDGSTVETMASDARLSKRDHEYLYLAWGDLFDLEFDPPRGLRPVDVVETRLTLTGHYQRDANVALVKSAQ